MRANSCGFSLFRLRFGIRFSSLWTNGLATDRAGSSMGSPSNRRRENQHCGRKLGDFSKIHSRLIPVVEVNSLKSSSSHGHAAPTPSTDVAIGLPRCQRDDSTLARSSRGHDALAPGCLRERILGPHTGPRRPRCRRRSSRASRRAPSLPPDRNGFHQWRHRG